jgi:flagellar basal body-associated protein FliL
MDRAAGEPAGGRAVSCWIWCVITFVVGFAAGWLVTCFVMAQAIDEPKEPHL